MIDQNKMAVQTIKDRILNLLLEIEDETTLLEIARSIHKQVLALNSAVETDSEGVGVNPIKEVEPAESIAPEMSYEVVAEPVPEPNHLIEIELRNEIWYATRRSDGRSFDLCMRLSKNEVEQQMNVKPPQKEQWELPADEARKIMKTDPDEIDFWDSKKGNITTRHFYEVKEYERGMDEWRKYVALAKDAVTRGLRLSVAARVMLEKLKENGYEVLLPDSLKMQIANANNKSWES